MKSFKQFWTLLRFQLVANPYVWFMMFAFTTPYLFMGHADRSLSLLVPVQNIFFVGLLGVLMLAPEILYSAAVSQWPVFGSEFLLTRAVDRRIVARAKSGSFYVLVLLVPLLILLSSLRAPDLQVFSYAKGEQQQTLASFPGSVLLKNARGLDHVSIPAGNILIATWHIWEFLVSIALVQLIIVFVYPLSYRRYVLWGIFGLMILAPLGSLYAGFGAFAFSEKLFFFYLPERYMLWPAAVLLLIICQLAFERRFAQLEV